MSQPHRIELKRLKRQQRIICKFKQTQVCLVSLPCVFQGGRSSSFCLPRLFFLFSLLQHLCPGLGVNTHTHTHTHTSHSCGLKLPPPLSPPLLVVQVAFVPGDRARAAWAGPAPRWWTAGGAVVPKLSPSPSVCIHTSLITRSASHSFECHAHVSV